MKETYPINESKGLRLRIILMVVVAVVALLQLFTLQFQLNDTGSGNSHVGVTKYYEDGLEVLDAPGSPDAEHLTDVDLQIATHFPFTAHIAETLQYPELPAGCEIVALVAVFRSMGFNLPSTELADEYLNTNYEGDFVHSYSGSPYDSGAGYPPVIVDCANAYLNAHNSSYQALDITGDSFESLVSMVREGYPVLIWTTISMEQPSYSGIYVDGYEWYENEHCVLFYGLGEGTVLINDPLEGIMQRDYDEFVQIYEACGKMAIVIR